MTPTRSRYRPFGAVMPMAAGNAVKSLASPVQYATALPVASNNAAAADAILADGSSGSKIVTTLIALSSPRVGVDAARRPTSRNGRPLRTTSNAVAYPATGSATVVAAVRPTSTFGR